MNTQISKHVVVASDNDGRPVYREVVAVVGLHGEALGGGGGGGGGGSGDASAANQVIIHDSIMRESARTQNVIAHVSGGAGTERRISHDIAAIYTLIAATAGLVAGDVVMQLTTYELQSGADVWTKPVLTKWVRIFNSTANEHTYEVLNSVPNKNSMTLDIEGVMTKSVSERTLERRALDSSLNESFVTATETRTVHASHFFPYPTISDSGWV